MSYYGEKGKLSFRDNFCEEIGIIEIGEIGALGYILGKFFNRVAIGYLDDRKKSDVYALAGGLSKYGCDVYLINHALPVFKYGIVNAGCDGGLFVCGEHKLKLLFFDKYGLALSEEKVKEIYESEKDFSSNETQGKISHLKHIDELYLNSIKKTLPKDFIANASISCGNRKIFDLWSNFFTSDSEQDLIFQVSEDGEKANCYSNEMGFISYERLLLAYSLIRWNEGDKIILPKDFHYVAEEFARKINGNFQYQSQNNLKDVYKQRFTFDALFLCTQLMQYSNSISEIMKMLPEFYTARRELASDILLKDSEKIVKSNNGKVKLSQSGKGRITVIAQSYNAETASELCGIWENVIRGKKRDNKYFS